MTNADFLRACYEGQASTIVQLRRENAEMLALLREFTSTVCITTEMHERALAAIANAECKP